MENYLSRKPRDRVKLAAASLVLILMTGPLTFALTMIWITQGFGESNLEFLFWELSFFALILAILALVWSIFMASWMDILLERMGGKLMLSAILLMIGTTILFFMRE